ncbi:dynamin-binding protein-like isoform X2 [Cherax quadricarinatus]|uniref:dynamin-binding protein-like isoform X2 n=1 Tax=Cherax quadricarinatus TaxID=27406 RepID=UPI00387E27A5
MKAGDVCRCISDFTGVSQDELTVAKNDIVQVHSVVDRHWLEGESGGSIGRVPSSILVKIELPPHPSHLPLFVASAEFMPSQPGDLGLARGDFVIGLNPIDESWWCGEVNGHKGIFPLNFVWSINKDIIEEEDTREKPVKMRGKVKMSLQAQLPEELDLYTGDIVNITHVVDKDYFRGEVNGATGTFPRSFVDVLEETSVPLSAAVYPEESNPLPFSIVPSDTPELSADFALQDMTRASLPFSDLKVPVPSVEHIAPATDYSLPDSGIRSTAAVCQPVEHIFDAPVTLSKTSSYWKTVGNIDDADIFDDDYFKKNMPCMFSSSQGSGNASTSHANGTCLITPFISQASASPFSSLNYRYENIDESPVLPDKSFNDRSALTSEITMGADTVSSKATDINHRYENILPANSQPVVIDGAIQSVTDSVDVCEDEPKPSAFSSVPGMEDVSALNSLSQKVDDYFSKNLLEDGDKQTCSMNKNSLIQDFSKLSSGYNEDNTGIEPYGRALFSFRAQYPNELTFKKGDIVHLLKHVDSHWTLGTVRGSKGIFPTSYVDIIVDCLYNEEELFLARSEAVLQVKYLGYARAEFDFHAVEPGDMSLAKGDILKVLKYVDNNWVIVENITGSKGMCPQNYLSIPTEGVLGDSGELNAQTTNSCTETATKRESRLPVKDAQHDRSRSSSPFSPSGYRRSYNKNDFGSIKKQEVDPVLAKTVASLDITLRSNVGQPDKKGSESIFTKREVCPSEINDQPAIEEEPVESIVTASLSKLSLADVAANNCISESSQETQRILTSVSQSSNTTVSSSTTSALKTSSLAVSQTASGTTVSKPPAVAPRSLNIPPVPPRTKVYRSDSSKSIPEPTAIVTAANSKAGEIVDGVKTGETVASVPVAKPPRQLKRLSKSDPVSQEPVYAKVQKPRLAAKPSLKTCQRKSVDETGAAKASLTRSDSASFPDDVSRVSTSSEGIYSTANDGSCSPVLAPQRPAPPPPLKTFDNCDDGQDYYSLPPEESEMVSMQELAISAGGRAESVASAGEAGTDDGTATAEQTRSAHGDEAVTKEEEAKAKVRANHRRELVQEIVTTEHEYIHDLEALIQVINLAHSQKESQSVNLDTLMGNINQVLEVAKKFLALLDKVAYETDDDLLVGRIFLLCADELCDVYKVYCSNHNVAVEPLLKQYIEEAEPAAFLQWVLGELQQHKIQLMDMRSVLIKPVQRVLKYPLFLDRLVSETPHAHPDYVDLLEAKSKMANVAKEINDYTKRLDLVNKYRYESDQSLQSKMQRVSLHSVAKKSARLSTLVSEMLGIMSQTKDPDFDEEVAKFRCVQKAAAAVTQNIGAVVQSIKARHKAELKLAKGLVGTLHQAARAPQIEAVQKAASDSCNKLFEMFDKFVQERILLPANQLLCFCEVPERLILKRNDKILDYDNAQYKLDKNKDPTRTRILEEELSIAKGTYEALNTQLMMDLPQFISSGTEIMILVTRTLVAARMYLQGHLAQLYLRLAQVPGLTYTGEEDMLAQFRVKYLQQLGEFRQLSFIPADTLQRTLPRAKPRGRKSLDSASLKKEAPESVKKKVLGSYPAEIIYVVTEVHTPSEVMELTLYPGDHVALLKNKDPLGRCDRWFVDDGENKGFARATSLKPLQGQSRIGNSMALPSATSHSTTPSSLPAVTLAPRPSTLPRAAPTPPIPERPPRYEDLFPATSGGPGIPSQVTGYPAVGQQVPPPRYTPGSLNPPPLPVKPGFQEQSSSTFYSQISESEYYSPPLDTQPSNEYNSPISEEDNNIYEEIDQDAVDGGVGQEEEDKESSPIYEVIEDGQLVQDSALSVDTQLSFLPGLEAEEPQFYYALYNFGGSDSTQLNLVAGQVVLILHAKSSDWWFVEDRNGKQGYVPATYLAKYS